MSFFTLYPKILYNNTNIEGNTVVVRNLLRRADISKIINQVPYFQYYTVKNGLKPDIIAHNYYEDSSLHWLILLANDIKDIYHEWPKTDDEFESYTRDLYGSEIYEVHHYEIPQNSGDKKKMINIGPDNTLYPSATPISNYEYELALELEKRKIRLVPREYIDSVRKQIKDSVKYNV